MKTIAVVFALFFCLGLTGSVQATVWVTPIPGGEIRFDDWGYTGPGGRGALEFAPVNGFGGPAEGNSLDPNGGIGQIQHVITRDPDWITPDPPYNFLGDLTDTPSFPNANMDTNVNFYRWGYSTVAGSTFNNMQIDYDGDYLVPKHDMSFEFYDILRYRDTTGVNPDQDFDTNIDFQPFAISDAIGWCGSILASHPAALEPMAGQVTFDFAFEAYFPWTGLGANGLPDPGEGSVQIVPGFIMRSYGTFELEMTAANGGSGDFNYRADAVVNNTDPTLGRDLANPMGYPGPAYYNRVSFMGGGVVPTGVWVSAGSFNPDGTQKLVTDSFGELRWDVTIVPEGTAGAVWHTNSFGGYPFLLRADADRFVDYFDEAVYGPSPVCSVDADCDNGEFCDGQETCDLNGFCQSGTYPCPGQTCDEVIDQCNGCTGLSAATIRGGGQRPTTTDLQIQVEFTVLGGGAIVDSSTSTVDVCPGTVLAFNCKVGNGPDPDYGELDSAPLNTDSIGVIVCDDTVTGDGTHKLYLTNKGNGGRDTDRITVRIAK